MTRELLDTDGENRAVRSFLMLYGGTNSVTIHDMLRHMELSGWSDTAPDFVITCRPTEHLTKAGAQIWLRHLFDLEKS